MCRWSSMSRREKCRCISLVILALIAIAGVVAMIWGSVAIWRVSKDGLAADGGDMMTILNPFVKCGNLQPPTGEFQYDVVRHALEFQCMAAQLPPRLVSGFASAFMILALLCAPCAFKKDKMFGFTLWSTLAIVMIVMSAAIVSVYALPAASHMAPNCSKYDQATIQELQTVGVVCLKGVPGVDDKTTALKWLCKLHMFYAGSIVCIVSLLLLFMCKHCCCCKSGAAGAGCCPSQQAAGVNGEQPCPIRRALCNFKARFCRRSAPLSSSADQDSSLPVSAPSYYQVHESSSEGASEDAGVSSANNYYGVN